MKELDRRQLAARSEILQERIENDHTCSGDVRDGAGSGMDSIEPDASVIADLRAHTDTDFDSIDPYLSAGNWPEGEPLPEWLSTFFHLVEFLETVDDTESPPVVFGRHVPFQAIHSWMIEWNRRNFTRHLDAERLATEAIHDLERYLMDRLSRAGAKALHRDFVEYVGEHEPEVIENGDRSVDSTHWFERYVSAFLGGRVGEFFGTYPVLARQMTLLIECWQEMVSRFVTHLDDDYHELCGLLGVDDPGAVTGLDLEAGDPHDGGRSVILVEFESEDEVVYKPASIESQKCLFELQSWLVDEFDEFPHFDTADLIFRSDHGWMEKVEPVDLPDVETVESYYRGAGALLCILYVLNASDCHFENVIAGERSPIIIDAEAILDAPITEVPASRLNEKIRRYRARSSLASTQMLPVKVGRSARDRSGLDEHQEFEGWTRKIVWRDVNTDAMDFEYRTPKASAGDNVPIVDGELASPDLFVDEIVEGFGTAYDEMSSATEEVAERITDLFEGVAVRKVLLASALYEALSKTLTNPEYLRSGALYGYRLQETLSRRISTLHDEGHADKWDDVQRAERTSILRGDIPKFTMFTDDCGVYYGGTRVCSTDFERTGLDRVRCRLDEMSEADKSYQQGLIEASFGEHDAAKQSHW